jgi:hypothetical protein
MEMKPPPPQPPAVISCWWAAALAACFCWKRRCFMSCEFGRYRGCGVGQGKRG